jgi:nucleoside phosphorylase
MPTVAGSLERYQRFIADALVERSQERIGSELFRLASNVRIGIVTALQIETDALLAVAKKLGGARVPVPRSALDMTAFYYPIQFNISDSEHPVHAIICQCLEMGNNSAAIAATCILKDYSGVENLIMTGVAGGVPASPSEFDLLVESQTIEDHVRLGDVVISKMGVFQYDLVKRSMGERLEYRATKKLPAANLLFFCNEIQTQIVNFEARVNTLANEIAAMVGITRPAPASDILQEFEFDLQQDQYLPVRSFLHPPQSRRQSASTMVHFGEIASANILLKDPKVRDLLRTLKTVRAVEMEGSGVADAAWTFHRGYIAIRGICDYCDPNKNDDWHPYAALVAAAATGLFIEIMYSAGVQS